ncbi:hypothetical protein [Variovorax soli]|uniref:Arc-like DNA binding domain-containing protein n=1 Tax=Variovorax soli TaxID=376815 RepID=A0ABU1NK40_9BURK|nr:hypothetical protein [Variovorax soli]MDR6538838.1 hypothetical protein [Variovorax soli]
MQIRLPGLLADRLRQQAALTRRSLNMEMVSLLEEASSKAAKKVKGRVAPTTQPLDETPIPSKGKEISHARE